MVNIQIIEKNYKINAYHKKRYHGDKIHNLADFFSTKMAACALKITYQNINIDGSCHKTE